MATAWLFHDSLVRQARLSRQPSCYRVNLCHLIGLLIASPSNVLICGLLLLRWGDWEHWDRQEEEMVTWWSQEDGWRFYWNVFHEKRCLWGRENSTIDFGQLFHITQLWLFRKRKELKAIALSLNHCTGFYRKYSLYLFCFIEMKAKFFFSVRLVWFSPIHHLWVELITQHQCH